MQQVAIKNNHNILPVAIMACLTRCAYLCNSGTDVMGLTNNFIECILLHRHTKWGQKLKKELTLVCSSLYGTFLRAGKKSVRDREAV